MVVWSYMTQDKLLDSINEILEKYNMDTLEAFVYFCESNDYDIEAVAAVIPQSLRCRMEADAKKKRLLKNNDECGLPL